MEEDDLPPHPAEDTDVGLSGAIGWTFSGFAIIAAFFAVAAALLYAAIHWLG